MPTSRFVVVSAPLEERVKASLVSRAQQAVGGGLQGGQRADTLRYQLEVLLRKAHALTGKPVEHMESPQVARYEQGQFYKMHFDSADEESDASAVGGGSWPATRPAQRVRPRAPAHGSPPRVRG